MLLQGRVNGIEFGAEVGAQTVHHRDDCQRDARCDQTVFNRGRPGLIGQELQEVTQIYLLFENPVKTSNIRKSTEDALKLNKPVERNFIYNCRVPR